MTTTILHTDEFGVPIVFTEWEDETGTPVLRDYREGDSVRTCTHYIPEATS